VLAFYNNLLVKYNKRTTNSRRPLGICNAVSVKMAEYPMQCCKIG